jgi:hypothetical protein
MQANTPPHTAAARSVSHPWKDEFLITFLGADPVAVGRSRHKEEGWKKEGKWKGKNDSGLLQGGSWALKGTERTAAKLNYFIATVWQAHENRYFVKIQSHHRRETHDCNAAPVSRQPMDGNNRTNPFYLRYFPTAALRRAFRAQSGRSPFVAADAERSAKRSVRRREAPLIPALQSARCGRIHTPSTAPLPLLRLHH